MEYNESDHVVPIGIDALSKHVLVGRRARGMGEIGMNNTPLGVAQESTNCIRLSC